MNSLRRGLQAFLIGTTILVAGTCVAMAVSPVAIASPRPAGNPAYDGVVRADRPWVVFQLSRLAANVGVDVRPLLRVMGELDRRTPIVSESVLLTPAESRNVKRLLRELEKLENTITAAVDAKGEIADRASYMELLGKIGKHYKGVGETYSAFYSVISKWTAQPAETFWTLMLGQKPVVVGDEVDAIGGPIRRGKSMYLVKEGMLDSAVAGNGSAASEGWIKGDWLAQDSELDIRPSDRWGGPAPAARSGDPLPASTGEPPYANTSDPANTSDLDGGAENLEW